LCLLRVAGEIEVVGSASKVFDLSPFPAREQSRLSLGDTVAFAD
jgi:hypothetical protein